MRIIAFIKDQAVITRILDHIGECSQMPMLSPARAPPMDESIDQMDLFEDAVDEIPAENMDQTVAW